MKIPKNTNTKKDTESNDSQYNTYSTDTKALIFIMEQESGLIFNLIIKYKEKRHQFGISSDYERRTGRFFDTLFFLDDQQFSSLEEFKTKAKIGKERFIDIKDKIEVLQPDADVEDLLMQYENQENEETCISDRIIETSTYGYEGTVDKAILIVNALAAIFLYAFPILWLIQGNTDYVYGLGVAIIQTIFTFPLYKKALKYRHLTSKVTIDENGIQYKSKAIEFFMPWNQVDTIETRIQRTKYFTFFFSKNSGKRKFINKPENLSNDLIFVCFDNRIINIIKRYWKGEINGLKHLNTKEEIKEIRRKRRMMK